MEQNLEENNKKYKLIILGMILILGTTQGILSAFFFPEGTSQLIPNSIASLFLSMIAIYWLIKDSERGEEPVSTFFIVVTAFFTTFSLIYYAFNSRGGKRGSFLIAKYFGYLIIYVLFLILGEIIIYGV